MTGDPPREGGRPARPRRLWADARRMLRIVRVLAGHGAAHLAGRRPGRLGRSLAGRLPAPGLGGPERLRTVFEELGGTFIKFGQMLALQPDILSIEHCNALFKLLDRVEPFPYADVERTFVEDLGRPPGEVFDEFEREPFAAASVGQVHRARLAGRELAVKVRRPSVETDFAGDLSLMRAAMAWIRHLRLRPLYWVLDPMSEFVAWTEEELDYRTEARYLERLRRNAEDNPKERVPEVTWELSGERILVLEYLAGPAVLDYVRALESGDEVAVRRLGVVGFVPADYARAVIENFLADAFRHGVFHADLHPANLLILPGNVVGYIDFGITGVLSGYSRRHLVAMTLAYTQGDLDAMCDAFFRVSTFEPGCDPRDFRHGIARLAESWYDLRGHRRRLVKNFTLVMLDMLKLSRTTGVWPERDVVKYIRSAIALDGLVERFAPGFDVGAYLARVCSRHLWAKGMEEAVSAQHLVDGALSGSRLARDGWLRGGALLDRLLAGELPLRAEDGAAPAAPGGATGTVVTAAVALSAALLLRFGGAPAELGWNLFTGQLVLVVAALAALLRGPRAAQQAAQKGA